MSDGRLDKGRATKDRLVKAARAQFGAHGYESTSVEAILTSANVKRGSFYHHFATKQALFDAVLDEVAAELAASSTASAAAAEDPVASLQAGCRAWLELALNPSVQQIALVDAPAVVGWSRWRELDEKFVLVGVRRRLEQIAEASELPPTDLDLLAHMVVAAVNEAAMFITDAEDPTAALATAQQTLDTLLRRLAGR